MLVLGYVGLAGTWIVTSSVVAGSSGNSTFVEIAKGLAFVAVTAGLLFALLLTHQRSTRPPPGGCATSSSPPVTSPTATASAPPGASST